MKYDLTNAFIKDFKKSPHEIQKQIKALIGSIEAAERLSDLQHVKKMKGFSDAYRIRLGEYRVGILMRENALTLARVLHRREVYRYFP